ncbi:MAG: hypothetical protein B655_1437 [Methanobacterium sp. Maddingley MBC34]|nr:MAG: hypothetical protein B655_1437 [Methanobacterium sp. Maddingley MBC34]
MTRSRRYLNNLPNINKIKDLARDILDCELKLDRVIQDNASIKNEILTLETQLLSIDKAEYPQKIKNIQTNLNELSGVRVGNDKKITELRKEIYTSRSLVDEEIREGLSTLFHQAKSDLEEAQQAIIKHQQLVEEAQNRFMNSPAEEFPKYRDEWIQLVKTVIEDEEEIKKSEKQLEAIKRVYKLEFG